MSTRVSRWVAGQAAALRGKSAGPILPPAGPSVQVGKIYPPPPVVIPPIGVSPPGTPAIMQTVANPATPTLQIQSPQDIPIPGATEFQQICTNQTISGVGTKQQLTLTYGLTPTAGLGGTQLLFVPLNYNGRIEYVNIFAGSSGGLTFNTTLLFTLFINGAPVPGWNSRTFFGRSASSLEQPFDARIIVPDSSYVTAMCTDVDGATYNIGLFFTGWIWPVSLGAQWIAGAGQYNGV